MPSDLESSLIDGGITPAAAKILSNAIGNAASGRTYTGRQVEDATPGSMRMVDRDTRRYVLTNLDHPSEERFRQRLMAAGVQFRPNGSTHPYADSQPSSGNPTLSTPAVAAGKYVSSQQKTTNDVAQSEVGLDVNDLGGSHPRLNKATGKIESVPFSVECHPKELIEASVEERNGRTVINIRLKMHPQVGRLVGFNQASHTSWRSGTTYWIVPVIT